MMRSRATDDEADPAGLDAQTILHASCVAIGGRGALIQGKSGRGKSGLALAMMALGADLIADDRVILDLRNGALTATVPTPIAGLIEARGIGLLNARHFGPVNVVCVVDMDQSETARMPQARTINILGQTVTLLLKVDAPHFPAALVQYLKAGRQEQR